MHIAVHSVGVVLLVALVGLTTGESNQEENLRYLGSYGGAGSYGSGGYGGAGYGGGGYGSGGYGSGGYSSGGYSGGNYGGQMGGYGNISPLFLNSSCKKYTCVPTTSPVANCGLVCSPDRKTPNCPVLNCISTSSETCSDFKCTVQTTHQSLYY